MKAQILIYDDNCPLCAWYSGLFVKYGFLRADERKPFSRIDDDMINAINFEKAKEEIPLIDVDTKEVVYGIDALVTILSAKFPFVKKVCAPAPVDWFLRRLYRLISYNRKVIVATRCSTGAIDCAPSYNYFYRLLFLCVFLVFNSLMLYPVHKQLLSHIPGYNKDFGEVQGAHFSLVAINCLLACGLPVKKAFEYIGQVNMLAVLTIAFLLMFIPVVSYLHLFGVAIQGYLLLLTIFILKEYLRRMDYAGVIQHNRWIAALNLSSIALLVLYIIG
jgi:hypothetical protein